MFALWDTGKRNCQIPEKSSRPSGVVAGAARSAFTSAVRGMPRGRLFQRLSLWTANRIGRTLHAFGIFVVLAADVLQKFDSGKQPRPKRDGERTGIGSWIVDGHLVFQSGRIEARPSFNYVEPFRMRMSYVIEPRTVVEPDGVDHKCVAVPATNRVSVPGWIQRVADRMPSAIHEDLSIAVALEKKKDVRRRLDEAPGQ
jgi:hypothetical protein